MSYENRGLWTLDSDLSTVSYSKDDKISLHSSRVPDCDQPSDLESQWTELCGEALPMFRDNSWNKATEGTHTSLSVSALPPPRAPQSARPITSQIFNWWFSAWAAWALPGWAAHCTGCRGKIKWATHQWTFLPALSLNSINLSRWFSHLQINTGRVLAVIYKNICIVINKHCL